MTCGIHPFSPAQKFYFHTSANWRLYRLEIHVEEVLRLPFLKPAEPRDSLLPELQLDDEILGKAALRSTGRQ